MKEKIEERLKLLKEFRRKGAWADSYDPSYSNGYDSAVDSEIEFLESLLK